MFEGGSLLLGSAGILAAGPGEGVNGHDIYTMGIINVIGPVINGRRRAYSLGLGVNERNPWAMDMILGKSSEIILFK